MRIISQSSSANVMVLMVSNIDHVTGEAGLTLTIRLSKDGGAFAIITPVVTDRSSGWYNIALTSTHTNVVGDLALNVTAPDADPSDCVCLVWTLEIKLEELHRIQGLDISAPVEITPTSRIATGVNIAIGGDGETISTLQRV